MYVYPNAHQESTFALATKVNDMKNFLRTFSNKIINLKRQKALLSRPPFQNYIEGRPPYQKNQYRGGTKANQA